MQRKTFTLCFLVSGVLIGMAACSSRYQPAPAGGTNSASPQSSARAPAEKPIPPIPAHFDHPPNVLGPTLPAEDFTGKTRAAYRVAEQIPGTLAQLPCYCYCDRGMGHKSLHSCFEDEHAAHCAVCVDEALLAYSLTKDAKMTPQQVREKIVEKYSVDQ
jgi:hypothetical protein